MSDEYADHHLGELIEEQGPTAIGWSEIRNALESIEMMRATRLEDARLLLRLFDENIMQNSPIVFQIEISSGFFAVFGRG